MEGDAMGPGEFLRSQFQLYRLCILERWLREAGAEMEAPPPPRTELRFLGRHARRDWVCNHATDADWPQFRTALQHDHDVVVARMGERDVGWAWIGYEKVFLAPLGRAILLPPGTGYLYEAYVRPDARGLGIGRALVAARCQQARRRRCERLLTHVVEGNVASLRALGAHGFAVVGRTHFLKALLLRVWTRAPLPSPPVPAPRPGLATSFR
jgi:GNAT superfamily N-acetyltransferase